MLARRFFRHRSFEGREPLGAAASLPAQAAAAVTSPRNSLRIFSGGGASTVALGVSLASRLPQPLLIAWAVIEVTLFVARLALATTRKPTRAGDLEPSLDWERILDAAGAASVSFGTISAVFSTSPFGAMLGWLTAVAFAGEAVFRHFSSPRWAATMITIACLPLALACLLWGDLISQLAVALIAIFAGRMIFAAYQLSEIVVSAQRAERDSDYQARHDRLTGLLNRAGLEREIELMRRERPRSPMTLFFIDLDHFKQVNDSFGHDMGDRLLRVIAEQLLDLADARDIVARFGGDEFVVVTTLGLAQPNEFGAAILSAVRSARDRLAITVAVSASIGINHGASADQTLAELIAVADIGAYQAKRAGGDQCSQAIDAPKRTPDNP